jgi:phosphomannomutase
MSYIDPAKIRPLKLVMNAGNGAAGHVVDAIEAKFKQLNILLNLSKFTMMPMVLSQWYSQPNFS